MDFGLVPILVARDVKIAGWMMNAGRLVPYFLSGMSTVHIAKRRFLMWCNAENVVLNTCPQLKPIMRLMNT